MGQVAFGKLMNQFYKETERDEWLVKKKKNADQKCAILSLTEI